MRILLLSQWYSPEPRKLISELAVSLQSMGHLVTVVTGFPNWPNGRFYAGYTVRCWQREIIEGVRVIRVPLFPDHSRNSFRRLLNFCSYALAATLLTPFLADRPDIIHAIEPIPAGFPAVFLGWYWRIPVTVEVQDLWPDTLEVTGFVSNRKLLGIVQWVVTCILQRSSRVRVISEGFRRRLTARGINEEKIDVISNWVDPEVYEGTGIPVDVEPPASAHELKILYAGSIGPAQDLDTVLEAASLLRDTDDIEFTIAGDGIERARLEKKAKEMGLSNICFAGWVPDARIRQMLRDADVLLLHLRNNPLFQITIPHKVFTYLAMGRPVLAAVFGETAEVVRGAGAGITCSPGDPVALAKAIRRFATMDPLQREAYGHRGRKAACERYSRTCLVQRFESVLRHVVESNA